MLPFLYKRKIILTHQINDRDIIMSLLEAINKNKITEIDSLLSLYNADVATCISILDHIRSCTDKRVTNYTYKKILRDLSSNDISRILSYLLEKERYLQVMLTIRNCRD